MKTIKWNENHLCSLFNGCWALSNSCFSLMFLINKRSLAKLQFVVNFELLGEVEQSASPSVAVSKPSLAQELLGEISSEDEAPMDSDLDQPDRAGGDELNAEVGDAEAEAAAPPSKRARINATSPLCIPEVSLSEYSAAGNGDGDERVEGGNAEAGNAVPTTLDAICDDLRITDDEEERDGFE